MKAFDAATAAMFDKIREERDYAQRCLTAALDDFHKVMAALDAEPAAANMSLNGAGQWRARGC